MQMRKWINVVLFPNGEIIIIIKVKNWIRSIGRCENIFIPAFKDGGIVWINKAVGFVIFNYYPYAVDEAL